MTTKRNKEIKDTIMKKKKKAPPAIYYPTGSDLLDMVVGGTNFGYPGGNIINVVGESNSGKTFLVCELIAAAFNKYGNKLKWIYDDCESGFTFDTEELYGFKVIPDEKDRRHSDTVESLYSVTRDFFENLKKDELGIYTVDSLDGLTSMEMKKRGNKRYNAYKKGKEYEEGSYKTEKAKFLSQEFLPDLADIVEKTNGLLVIISQTRAKIGSLFPGQTIAGGKALKFYSHTQLWLSSLQTIVKKQREIGYIVKAKTKKNKTSRPYRSCIAPIFFDYGLDNIGANIDFLYGLRTEVTAKLNEKAKKIKWDKDSEEITRSQLISFIEENDLQKELTKRVREKWEEIENSIKTDRPRKYQKG